MPTPRLKFYFEVKPPQGAAATTPRVYAISPAHPHKIHTRKDLASIYTPIIKAIPGTSILPEPGFNAPVLNIPVTQVYAVPVKTSPMPEAVFTALVGLALLYLFIGPNIHMGWLLTLIAASIGVGLRVGMRRVNRNKWYADKFNLSTI